MRTTGGVGFVAKYRYFVKGQVIFVVALKASAYLDTYSRPFAKGVLVAHFDQSYILVSYRGVVVLHFK